MTLQERTDAVAELRHIASRARHLSKLLPSLVSKVEHDECIAEFHVLYDRFQQVRGQLDDEHYDYLPAWLKT